MRGGQEVVSEVFGERGVFGWRRVGSEAFIRGDGGYMLLERACTMR